MWKSAFQSILNVLRSDYGGRAAGFAAGLFLAFLYLFVGFWDMLIFAFIVFVGYYIGWNADRGQSVFPWRPIAEWLSERWKGFK